MSRDTSSSYEFDFIGGFNSTYAFVTNQGIVYEVKFKPSTYIFGYQTVEPEFVYEFVIEIAENLTGKKPLLDNLIPTTIAAIFYDFFKLKETVVVYICDDRDGKAKARNRKFGQWFEQYNRLIFLKFDFLLGTESEYYFTTMITRFDNPKLSEIIKTFQNLNRDYKK
jgi:hypothetical protein